MLQPHVFQLAQLQLFPASAFGRCVRLHRVYTCVYTACAWSLQAAAARRQYALAVEILRFLIPPAETEAFLDAVRPPDAQHAQRAASSNGRKQEQPQQVHELGGTLLQAWESCGVVW
jgi:hypothetical protein